MRLFLQVIVCIALVIAVGTWLSQSADILAEKTGLGRTWVGTILLAGVTSLPEFVKDNDTVREFASSVDLLGSDMEWLVNSGLFDAIQSESLKLEEYSKDFDNPDIKEALNSYGCRILFKFDTGVNYVKSQIGIV